MTADPATNPPRPRRRVLQNVLFSVLTKAVSAAFSYVTTRLLLDCMSVEEFGLYSLLFTGILVGDGLAILLRWGIPNVLFRFLPEYYARANYRIIEALHRRANQITIITGILALGLVYVFATPLTELLKQPGAEPQLRIFAVGGLAFLISENYRILLASLFQQRTIFFVITIYNALRLAAIFYVWQWARSLDSVVIAETLLMIACLLLYLAAHWQKVRPLFQSAAASDEEVPWRRFRRYAGMTYVNEVGVTVLGEATNLFLVSGMLGGIAAGYYGLANRILNIVRGVLPNKLLDSVIDPLFYSEYGQQKARAEFGYNLLMKTAAFATIPTAVWLGLMARPVIVDLFDARYGDAAPIIWISALFFPMTTLRTPLAILVQNAERIDLLIFSKVWGIGKILAGLWLVPTGGAIAMAWIAGVALTAQNVTLYYWITTKLRTRTDLWGLAKQVINGIVAGLLCWPLLDYFHGVAGIAASVFVYGGLFLGLSLLNKSFTREERDFINTHLKRNVWHF
ncbi:lipopolysaccharide biosynthesis protein [candidate division KSB1 bacterium]|nr:lipopolysaccharide biosynthesis protein [candidate division KSB1 bacterium]